jgi:sulfite exporter TauE/SafE
MSPEITNLVYAAASIGLIHTLIGVDHYLPFVVLAKARKWSMLKTLSLTVVCGVGHVLGSVILGLIGVFFGVAISNLVGLDSLRGDFAGWILTTFGLVYMIWGLRKVYLKHGHVHFFGKKHHHNHNQDKDTNYSLAITPWILFTIFVFGPCEPLIPILMYPAAQNSYMGMALVTGVFAFTTISTMVLSVSILFAGIKMINTKPLEKYTHALAGFTILICGLAIQFGL